MILSILDSLAATTKRTEKEAILKASHDNELLKRVVYMTYNPFLNYYIRPTEDMLPNESNPVLDLNRALSEVEENILIKGLRGNEAREFLEALFMVMWDSDAEVLLRVLNRDLRVGCSTATFNKIWKGLIPTFTLMACESLNDKTESLVQPGWYAQLKHDGARVAIVYDGKDVTFFSRRGRDYNMGNQALIKTAKQIGGYFGPYVIDGEMLQVDEDGKVKDRKTSNGVATKMVRGTASQEDYDRTIINTWDIIPLSVFLGGQKSEPYHKRLDTLNEAVYNTETWGLLNAERPMTIQNVTEGRMIARKYMAKGYEGAILKDPNGLWEPKRVKTQLKVKAVLDADIRVVNLVEGTGKYVGMLGAVQCANDEGTVFVDVGSGFKDAERKQFWENPQEILYKVIALEYNEIIDAKNRDTHSLFLPIFIEVRHDKDETDSLQKLRDSE